MTIFGFEANELIQNGRIKEEDIIELKKWTQRENLPDYTDEIITTFLIACKNNMEDAKICAKEYYLGRNRSPEVFSNRDTNQIDLITQFDTMLFAVSSCRTEKGEAALYMKIREHDIWRYNNALSMKLFFMAVDSILFTNPPNGLILTVDTSNLGLVHIVKTDLFLTKRMLTYLYSGMNTKLVGINLVNVNWIAKKFLGLLKPFIKTEIYSLLSLHTSGSEYSNFFNGRLPKECLPKEYGGEDLPLEDLSKNLWRKYESNNMKEYFIREELMRNLRL